MINKLKKIKRVAAGKDFFANYKCIDINKKKYGSDYGGWWICPDQINNDSVIISAGLGEDLSFDVELIKNYNCKIIGIDPTPKSIKYVESLNINNLILLKCALSHSSGFITFNLPKDEKNISGSLEKIDSERTIEVESKSLSKICKELSLEKIDILKMDIEGAEYAVIDNILNSNILPKQILVEFHHFFDSIDNQKTKKSINSLLSCGYNLFHIEDYNYCFIYKTELL